jgi:hypothetical protein
MRRERRYLWLIVVALAAACSDNNGPVRSSPRPDLSACSGCDGSAGVTGDLARVQDLAGGAQDLAPATGDMGRVCKFPGAAQCNHNAVCPGASGGCCAQGEWCKDGNTCLCGTNPACTGKTVCSSGTPEVNGCGSTCCAPPGCP